MAIRVLLFGNDKSASLRSFRTLERMILRVAPQPDRLQIQVMHRPDVPDRPVAGAHQDARRDGREGRGG